MIKLLAALFLFCPGIGFAQSYHNHQHNKTPMQTELTTSKYFKIIKVEKSNYLHDAGKAQDGNDGGVFEFEFEVQNISQYTFDGGFNFYGTINYKWHNVVDNETGIHTNSNSCISYIKWQPENQFEASNSSSNVTLLSGDYKNWAPDSIKHFYFTSGSNGTASSINCYYSGLQYYKQNMDDITLILDMKAMSYKNNINVDGAFAKYNILSDWKKIQISNK